MSSAGANHPPPRMRDYGRSVPVRAAVWDLGSSSFQVLVCDAGPCGTLEPVMRRRALLNLGFAVGARGSIPPDRLAASIAAAGRLRRALDEVQPDVVVALATAAIRDASNGPEVVARLERVVGTPVRVLGRRGGGPPVFRRPAGRGLDRRGPGPRSRPRRRELRGRRGQRPARSPWP